MTERGIIQFRLDHSDAPAPPGPVLQHLDVWRTRLHDLGLIGVYANGLGYGNLSLQNEDGFWISGTQTGHIRELGASGYCLVEGLDIEANLIRSRGPVPPSSEALTHGAVYRSRQDVGAVIHVHHAALWEHAIGRMPSTPPEIEAGTPQMAIAIDGLLVEAVHLPLVMVMEGHQDGLIACGGTIDESGLALERLLASTGPRP